MLPQDRISSMASWSSSVTAWMKAMAGFAMRTAMFFPSHGDGASTGSVVSVPVFRRAAAKILEHLSVAYDPQPQAQPGERLDGMVGPLVRRQSRHHQIEIFPLLGRRREE